MAYLCFQGDLSSFDEKYSFQEELKEEKRSNEASRDPKEAAGRRDGRAWCCTIVLQWPKPHMGCTAVHMTVRRCMADHVSRPCLVLGQRHVT